MCVCVNVLASDVNTLVRILTNRNNAQRQSIAESYHNLTQKVTITTVWNTMWICQPNTCGSVSLPIDYFYIYKGTVGRDVIYGIGTQPNSLYLPLLCRSCVLPWRKLCQGGWSNSCWGWWWPPLSLTPIASDSPWRWEQITCYFNDHCNKHVIHVICIFRCVITVCTVMWFEWMCGSLCVCVNESVL